MVRLPKTMAAKHPEISFSDNRGQQETGSGGNGTSEVGATSSPVGQTGMVAQKNGVVSHHLTPVASDHNEGEREGDDEPPPAKKAQPGSDCLCRL